MLERMEQVVILYTRKAQKLLKKDQDRQFRHPKQAKKLDESFGHVESHPSIFGTQPELPVVNYSEESDSESESDASSESEESSGGQEEETGSDDEHMDDMDELSERLTQSQLSSSQKRKRRRGKYKKKQKLNDPNMDAQTRRDRMKAIKEKLQEFADEEHLSLITIIALLLKNEAYIYNRHIARVADAILTERPLDPIVSIQEAIYLRYDISS